MNEMRHGDKPPGKTVAEALGIEVPANAPGGAPIASALTAPVLGPSKRSRAGHASASAYDGIGDTDGFGRAEK